MSRKIVSRAHANIARTIVVLAHHGKAITISALARQISMGNNCNVVNWTSLKTMTALLEMMGLAQTRMNGKVIEIRPTEMCDIVAASINLWYEKHDPDNIPIPFGFGESFEVSMKTGSEE